MKIVVDHHLEAVLARHASSVTSNVTCPSDYQYGCHTSGFLSK